MSIIYCDEVDLAIYVPPKCGTQITQKLMEFPEFGELFYVNDATKDDRPRRFRALVFRNHLERILSTYYDKIVDPTFNNTLSPGWRAMNPDTLQSYGKDPTYLGYHREGFATFQQFLLNLAVNTEWRMGNERVPHMLPYTTDPTAVAGMLNLNYYMQYCEADPSSVFPTTNINLAVPGGHFHKIIWTHELKQLLIPTIVRAFNDCDKDYLAISEQEAAKLQARWEDMNVSHKLTYSTELPPSQEYGSDSWSTVTWEELFRCSKDHGALPARNLMYNELCEALVRSQIGYRLDNWRINEGLSPQRKHDLLSLRK